MYNTQHNNADEAKEGGKERTQNEQMNEWKETRVSRGETASDSTGMRLINSFSVITVTNITLSQPDGGIYEETADMFSTVTTQSDCCE